MSEQPADARPVGPSEGAVSVVIVSHRSESTIAAAIAPLRQSSLVEDVVVVDNASDDGSADAARCAGASAVVRLPTNAGFATAVNYGLRRCNAPFVLLLNPDASIAPADLDRLVAALDREPAAVAVGPVLEGEDGHVTSGARRFSTVSNRLAVELPLLWRHDRLTSRMPRGALRGAAGDCLIVDYVWGAAVLVRLDFLRAVGGLDERFFLYHEDEDLGRQAHATGRRVLLDTGARARHIGAVSSSGDTALAHARLLFATGQLLQKWSWPGSRVVFLVGVWLALGLQAAAALINGDPVRREHSLRCARLLLSFWRRRSARP